MKRYFDYYTSMMKLSVLEQWQYPVANYFYMIGMIAEPDHLHGSVVGGGAGQQGGHGQRVHARHNSPPITSCGRWCAR
jgi:hypothetical protein